MTLEEIEIYLTTEFQDVHRETNYGYAFFFFGQDRRLPFVTIAYEDNDYDKVSNLSREGVFRINIGPGKAIFQSLFPQEDLDAKSTDYTQLDTFMPHPDYAAQFWVCILSPSAASEPNLKSFISEAYQIARLRDDKLSNR